MVVGKFKPRFIRRARVKAATPLNTTFGAETFKAVSTESKLTELEMLITEWCIKYPPSMSPHKFMREVKMFSNHKVASYIKAAPTVLWQERRREYQNMITKDMVKSQLDFVTEMNDMHIRASKLGLAKAVELLSKMVIESYRDKTGAICFTRFKPSDVKSCLESIAVAQRIQRTALGLPSDEGAITVWQQLNINQRAIDHVSEGPGDTASISQVENAFSYDELKVLIEAQRKGLLPVGVTIDVSASSDRQDLDS